MMDSQAAAPPAALRPLDPWQRALRVCPSCRRVRDPRGRWMRLSASARGALSGAAARLSSGLCDTCAAGCDAAAGGQADAARTRGAR